MHLNLRRQLFITTLYIEYINCKSTLQATLIWYNDRITVACKRWYKQINKKVNRISKHDVQNIKIGNNLPFGDAGMHFTA